MKKNKRLMVIVCILLLTGGVSLAYFIGSLVGGTGASTNGSIANINGAILQTEGILEFNDTDFYPGHQNVSSIKLTATADNIVIPYNLIWTGTNSLNTTLNFTVYKTSSEIEVEAICEKKTTVVNGALLLKEECELSNKESLGASISSGTIETSTTSTKLILAKDETITATEEGTEVYYYVVLEYPNLEEIQNDDIGGSFSGVVNVEASESEIDVNADINILAVYIENESGEYEESSDIPQSGYVLNTEKSTCTNGAIPKWDYNNNGLLTTNLTKSGTSCNLYFDNVLLAKDMILLNKSIQTREDFSVAYQNTTTGIMFSAEDNDGITYYYAGVPSDNYVKFAGFYWRIIRRNGDGTIRMIYAGNVDVIDAAGANKVLVNGYNDADSDYSQIGLSTFNTNRDDNMYVGYMYTSGQVHGFGTSSTIKEFLDMWYQDNLISYTTYIDYNAGFCGDRQPTTSTSTNNGSGGTGGTNTYYAAYRIDGVNKPTLKCVDAADLYTTSSSTKGNKALTYPIGLISADEVAYAGTSDAVSNLNFFLYKIIKVYCWNISSD